MKQNREGMMNKIIDNVIGAEGAEAISESLKVNTSLRELHLRSVEREREKKRRKRMSKNYRK